MALWASRRRRRHGFISGPWLCLAIISVPRGYIVSEPLLALCTRVEDLIYLSQGLRDHPTRLLYRIIPHPLPPPPPPPPRAPPRGNGGIADVTCGFTPVKQSPGWSSMRNGARRKSAFKCIFVFMPYSLERKKQNPDPGIWAERI